MMENNSLYNEKTTVPDIRKEMEVKSSTGIWTEEHTGMEFVYVPSGTFMMGDIFGTGDEDQQPVHEVRTDAFYIGKYTVTQGQWKKVSGENPSFFQKGDNYPVENISWEDAQEFIAKLTSVNKGRYRFALPTEARWEYAARSGGGKEKFSGGNDPDMLAWYNKNSRASTHPVGMKQPNRLGIYDMSGNVWEWCHDVYEKNAYSTHQSHNPVCAGNSRYRVIRGGSWRRDSGLTCCTVRRCYSCRDSAIGLRLVRES